jgi:hypothetical protein
VQRAEAELDSLEQKRRDLESEAEEQVRALQDDSALDSPDIEEVIVRPRKSDIQVTSLRLAWKRG